LKDVDSKSVHKDVTEGRTVAVFKEKKDSNFSYKLKCQEKNAISISIIVGLHLS
jgi:hypothetical protein